MRYLLLKARVRPEIKLKLMSITLTLAIVMTQKQLPPLSSCVYNVNVLRMKSGAEGKKFFLKILRSVQFDHHVD